jgi:hypothetical protein
MKTTTVSLFAVLALSAGACQSNPAPREPELVSGGIRDGRGYPAGSSASGPSIVLSRTATSETYGYSPEEPVLVGSEDDLDGGPRRSRLYLSALRGPAGQPISFERRGACCHFATEHSPLGGGLLDVYELTYDGLEEPIVLYLNMYDPGEPLIPVGLTARE